MAERAPDERDELTGSQWTAMKWHDKRANTMSTRAKAAAGTAKTRKTDRDRDSDRDRDRERERERGGGRERARSDKAESYPRLQFTWTKRAPDRSGELSLDNSLATINRKTARTRALLIRPMSHRLCTRNAPFA